ncbi:hypothetical protein Tco_0796552 [Tanacetum coccineum]
MESEIGQGLQVSLVTCEDDHEQFAFKEFLPIRSIFLVSIKVLKSKQIRNGASRHPFSLRLSSFLLDGNGIDALGSGVTTGAKFGLGFGLRD